MNGAAAVDPRMTNRPNRSMITTRGGSQYFLLAFIKPMNSPSRVDSFSVLAASKADFSVLFIRVEMELKLPVITFEIGNRFGVLPISSLVPRESLWKVH